MPVVAGRLVAGQVKDVLRCVYEEGIQPGPFHEDPDIAKSLFVLFNRK